MTHKESLWLLVAQHSLPDDLLLAEGRQSLILRCVQMLKLIPIFEVTIEIEAIEV